MVPAYLKFTGGKIRMQEKYTKRAPAACGGGPAHMVGSCSSMTLFIMFYQNIPQNRSCECIEHDKVPTKWFNVTKYFHSSTVCKCKLKVHEFYLSIFSFHATLYFYSTTFQRESSYFFYFATITFSY